MAKLIKYAYETENVSNKQEIENKIKTLNGVKECLFEGDIFTYVLSSSADEYDILVQSMNLCEENGGELFVAEDNVVPLDKTFSSSKSLGENEETSQDVLEDEEMEDCVDNEPIGALIDENGEEFEEENEKPLKKPQFQELKKQDISSQMKVAIVELTLATVLFVISLFMPINYESAFSGRNILAIFAFALSGYEIFYQAIADFVKKKFFTENIIILFISILAVLLGAIVEISAVLILISVAKQIELYFESKLKFNLNERFSTGQNEITASDGSLITVDTLKDGDELSLNKYDYVPCDSIALEKGLVDSFYLTGEFEQKLAENDEVLAGSVVLSDSLKIKVKKSNEESVIVKQKKAFEEKLKEVAKPSKTVLYANLFVFVIAVCYAFLMPFIAGASEYYTSALALSGQRAIAMIFSSLIIYQFSVANKCKKFAFISARINEIDYDNETLICELGLANSFEMGAGQLTENGELKEDSIGAMKELLSLGVQNVTTNFEGVELKEEVKKQIDFVDKAFKGEKKFKCYEKIAFSQEDGKISILNNEISFLPLAYKLAKKANKREKIIKILSVIFSVLLVPTAIFIPFSVFNPIYLGAIGSLISLISVALLITTIPKNN